jgi:hypothetical protein
MTIAAPPITIAIPSNSLHLTACIATAPDMAVGLDEIEDVFEEVEEAVAAAVPEVVGLP